MKQEISSFNTLRKEWRRTSSNFLIAAKKLSPELAEISGVCGDWSPKDVVAHLTGWNYEAVRHYCAFQAGATPAAANSENAIDAYNARFVTERSHLTWEQALQALEDSLIEFEKAVDKLPPEEIPRHKRYTEWLQWMGEDYENHLQHVKER
jgi:hypothetical protein